MRRIIPAKNSFGAKHERVAIFPHQFVVITIENIPPFNFKPPFCQQIMNGRYIISFINKNRQCLL